MRAKSKRTLEEQADKMERFIWKLNTEQLRLLWRAVFLLWKLRVEEEMGWWPKQQKP